MIKDQCNNCRKNGTSSCTKSIIYDSRPCDEYVKRLDLSKNGSLTPNAPHTSPSQQQSQQNNNYGCVVSPAENNIKSRILSIFSFKGRIRRTQYWITNFLIGLLFIPTNMAIDFSYEIAIYTLIIFIPAMWISLSNSVKRFHDLGKSGWFTCFLFLPIVNLIFGIYAALFKGEERDNEYGPNPY